jgi:hypothetical protein
MKGDMKKKPFDERTLVLEKVVYELENDGIFF